MGLLILPLKWRSLYCYLYIFEEPASLFISWNNFAYKIWWVDDLKKPWPIFWQQKRLYCMVISLLRQKIPLPAKNDTYEINIRWGLLFFKHLINPPFMLTITAALSITHPHAYFSSFYHICTWRLQTIIASKKQLVWEKI